MLGQYLTFNFESNSAMFMVLLFKNIQNIIQQKYDVRNYVIRSHIPLWHPIWLMELFSNVEEGHLFSSTEH